MKELRNSILCIALVIATLSLSMVMVRPACAQPTEPSPPKFTIQVPNTSTIQLVIENQAVINSSSVNSLVYYFRVKDHNSDVWVKDGDYYLQSNSDTTIISIPPIPGLPVSILSLPLLDNSTLLDFQVQAVTGFYSVTWQPGYMPGMPTQCQTGDGYWDITFNPAQSSDWSPTQTVAMPVSSNSPSSTLVPTQVPFSTSNPTANSTSDPTNMATQNKTTKPSSTAVIPVFLWLVFLTLFLSIFCIAEAFRHRKIINVKKETSCECSKSGTRCSKSRTKRWKQL